MKKTLFFTALTSLFFAVAVAQNDTEKPFRIPCYTEEHLSEQAQKHPELLQIRDALERELMELISSASPEEQRNNSVPRVIPVVFHIIHAGGQENISKAQCEDQIRILNQDFQRLNADTTNTPTPFKALSGNANIEFKLAKKDPNGNCTEGITRTFSTMTNGPRYRDDTKGLIYWPRNKYLNIWVVSAIYSGTSGGTILGYAQFPGFGSSTTDGICLRADQVGSIGLATSSPFGNGRGRTATHEVGHWLNLRHIWGDATCGSDQVSDTPTHEDANAGCPSFPHNANSPCGTGANGEMFTNYMDYSNGSCLNMFSNGQCTRMNTALSATSGQRNSLFTASNLTATGTDLLTPPQCPPKADYAPWGYKYVCRNGNVTFTDRSYNGVVTARVWNFPGGNPSTSTDSTIVVNYTTPGVYDVSLTVSNAAGNNTTTRTGRIIVLQDTSTSVLTVTEDFENTASANSRWTVLNNDNDAGWQIDNSTSFTGTQCFKLQNFGNVGALVDEFVSPTLNFTNLSSPILRFKLHFATTDIENNDQLKVFVSSNCGLTWTQRYIKTANATTLPLNTTTSVYGSDYTPTRGSSQWREEVVNIPNLTTRPNSRIRFEFTSGYGNNIFIDDINITGTPTNLYNINKENLNFSVAPNPVVNESNVTFNITEGGNALVKISDVLGKDIAVLQDGYMSVGEQTFVLKKSDYSSGLYFVNIIMNGVNMVEKIVIQ